MGGFFNQVMGVGDPNAAQAQPGDLLRTAAPGVRPPVRVPMNAGATPPMFAPPAAALPAPSMPQDMPGGPTPGIVSAAPTPPVDPSSIKADPFDVNSALSDYAAKNTALSKILGERPDVKPNWKNALFGGLTTFGGGMLHNANAAKEGWDVANMPETRALERWNSQVGAAKQDLAGSLQNIDLSLKAAQEKSRVNDETAQAQQRAEESKYRQWQMGGGPEQSKLDLDEKDRNKRADALAASGYDPKMVAEFRATGTLRDLAPKSEFEMAIAAHQVGPDGKPTAEAQQAALGLKTINEMRIKQIQAAKDPNEKGRFAAEYNTSLTAVRSQMDRELAQLENSPGARFDKPTQQRIQALRDSMANYDKELNDVRGLMRQSLGIQGEGATAAQPGATAFKIDPAWPKATGVPDGKVLRNGQGQIIARARGGAWTDPNGQQPVQ